MSQKTVEILLGALDPRLQKACLHANLKDQET